MSACNPGQYKLAKGYLSAVESVLIGKETKSDVSFGPKPFLNATTRHFDDGARKLLSAGWGVGLNQGIRRLHCTPLDCVEYRYWLISGYTLRDTININVEGLQQGKLHRPGSRMR